MIYNPTHPGKMIKGLCLDPLGISITKSAKALKIARPTLSKLINGHIGISPEMAIRLSEVFDTSAEFWINLQAAYDLHQAEKMRGKLHLQQLKQLKKAA